MDLDTIINELKSGDNACLKLLFEKYSDYCITNLMRKYNCTLEDSEDIFLDSLLVFRDNVLCSKLTYLTNTRNYIYTICCNQYLRRYQIEARKRSKEEELRFNIYDENEEDDEYKKELLEITRLALSKIGVKCRDLLALFYADGTDMNEIALMMDFKNSSVAKTAKSRCFKKLMEEVRLIQEKAMSHGEIK